MVTANTHIELYKEQANTHVTLYVGTIQSMLQTPPVPSFLLYEIQSC